MIYCAKFGVKDYLAALYICFYTFSLLSIWVSIRKEQAFKFPIVYEIMSCEQSKKLFYICRCFPKDLDGTSVVILPKVWNWHLTHKK